MEGSSSSSSSYYSFPHHLRLILTSILLVSPLILLLQLPCRPVDAAASASNTNDIKRFHFNLEWKNISRLCNHPPKQLLTVNGKFPGPTIAVREGDHVHIRVTNHLPINTTLHWHGVRQMRSGWADGPAYITQCPIGPGQEFNYKFRVVEQRGTLWWHAHFAWQRASVYGAFIIFPANPTAAPDHRLPPPLLLSSSHSPAPPPIDIVIDDNIHNNVIIFGEWWNRDVQVVETEMMLYGGGPNASDAYTINGFPGPLYPVGPHASSSSSSPSSCSIKDSSFVLTVEAGKTYLLRIINAALNDELFFAIADHNLTVVEIDAVYTKPFTTPAIMIAPGQTTNVLLTASASASASGGGMFVMAARPYLTSVFPFDNSTTIGFLNYRSPSPSPKLKLTSTKLPNIKLDLPPNLPALQDTQFATQFANSLRSLASPDYPCRVPKTIDKRILTTIGLNLQDCPANQTCQGYLGKRFFASMNNQSFIRPSLSMLQSHYRNLEAGFSSDFPDNPPEVFNYTGVDPLTENMNTEFGSKVIKVDFGTKLEIVLQDTNFLNPENHPIHFHGHNFFVVGRGFGNFDASRDPDKYNLVDPAERNTVAVPMGGWAAIRLVADNPGVWFIHCHLEEHTSWGLASALIVKDGKEEWQRLQPPPSDMPTC